MFPVKRYLPIAAVFAIPVFCCFIGVGVFLQVIVSAMEQERKVEAAAREQEQAKREQELRDSMDGMNAEADKTQQSLRAEERRIAELLRKLGLAQRDQKRGRDLQSQTAAQQAQLEELLEQIDASRGRLAELERSLEHLRDAEKVHRGELASKGELERRLDEAERQHRELLEKLEQLEVEIENAKKLHIDELEDGVRHSRKPVFVECTDRAAIIQPEGTLLGSNPDSEDRKAFLDAAKRTRYVVFMIRPDGFYCFHKYRDLIVSANQGSQATIDFGFEPVNADWELVYPGQEN